MKEFIKKVYERKEHIHRYGMLSEDIYYLYAIIEGTIYSQEIHGNLSKENKLFKENFSRWVCKYYSEEDLNKTWEILILFKSINSKHMALDHFLDLYKEWYIEEFGEDAW